METFAIKKWIAVIYVDNSAIMDNADALKKFKWNVDAVERLFRQFAENKLSVWTNVKKFWNVGTNAWCNAIVEHAHLVERTDAKKSVRKLGVIVIIDAARFAIPN